MPIEQRQSSLFVAEDWRVFYRAFTEVNFTAYDFDTIRSAMIDYLRRNFPEDFNDWIESSEFVSIIELLAYLGQSLAFRIDLNTRENFLDTAERRQSILKLARFLSYEPTRNQAATGLLKITQISTNQNIFDSNGTNLANKTVQWNDVNNPDWFEQFILVINANLNASNQFGQPIKVGSVGGVVTQLYSLNNTSNLNGVYSFSAQINSKVLPFEVVNMDFEDQGTFTERAPNPLNAFHMAYRNDGAGNASENTGFFLMFKQGAITSEDFTIETPIENRVININQPNINDTDVYVQEIDQDGYVVEDWVKVPAVVGSNVIFNSVDQNERNIYSVITKENDQIALRFADGRFGNAPSGFYRVWFRQSANERFQISTDNMSNVSVDIPYFSDNNTTFNTRYTLALQASVFNASPTETNENVKLVAPQMFYTQDRMVNGEDYNIFPLSNPETASVKSVNRIYSGFSRYIDINDPTGQSQDVNLFAEDGLFYQNNDIELSQLALPSALDDDSIIAGYIQPLALEQSRKHFYYFNYPHIDWDADPTYTPNNPGLFWVPATTAINSSTGFFSVNGVDPVQVGEAEAATPLPPTEFFLDEGGLIEFENAGWVSIINVINGGLGLGDGILDNGDGAVLLAEPVALNDPIKTVIPQFRTTFTTTELAEIEAQLSFNNNFGIRYDINTNEWDIITGANLNITDPFSLTNTGSESGLNEDTSWLIRAEFTQSAWNFYARTLDYIYESTSDIRFYFDSARTVVDANTGLAVSDFINMLKVNPEYAALDTGLSDPSAEVEFEESNVCDGLGQNQFMDVYDVFREEDGYVDVRRIKLTFTDIDDDGIPDDPTMFETITAITRDNIILQLSDVILDITELFFETFTNNDGYEETRPSTAIIAAFNTESVLFTKATVEAAILAATGTPYTVQDGDVIYVRDTTEFLKYDEINDEFALVENEYFYRRGRAGMYFQWKHYAPPENRIDPAITNIIDNYVLTVGYDTLVRQWIDNNGTLDEKPEPPTTEDLRTLYQSIEEKKMLSDQLIWHPVSYKVLFGTQAEEELRASFKVTKVPGTEVSDGEIKSRIISAMNEFFAIGNFDFGETFYFTELAAFVHQKLATVIGSIVIVPLNEEVNFGGLFQVRSNPDEVFISSAKVSDIQIVESFNDNILRIGN